MNAPQAVREAVARVHCFVDGGARPGERGARHAGALLEWHRRLEVLHLRGKAERRALVGFALRQRVGRSGNGLLGQRLQSERLPLNHLLRGRRKRQSLYKLESV